MSGRVHIDEPWLSHIVSGVKTHEGRVRKKAWATLAVGDRFEAYSDKFASVQLEVTEILPFADFDEAFAALGKNLLPENAQTPEEVPGALLGSGACITDVWAQALAIYRQWNPVEMVQEFGVIAVGVKVGAVQLQSDTECETEIKLISGRANSYHHPTPIPTLTRHEPRDA